PDFKLVIIGDGDERAKLESLCVELGVGAAVEFRGTQGRQYISDELNKSVAFVLTSVSEGFPKVIIEAMATGTPVIASDSGNVKNVIGDYGIIFPCKNSHAVCSAMNDIINDDQFYKECAKRVEERAQQYSWEHTVEKLDTIYRSLLGER
ncbi:MAG: glycosyltransferase, partial [Lachnospiraceae bacterium]|nr:glycosyltransferase [Lachnospiraceae bacterium]